MILNMSSLTSELTTPQGRRQIDPLQPIDSKLSGCAYHRQRAQLSTAHAFSADVDVESSRYASCTNQTAKYDVPSAPERHRSCWSDGNGGSALASQLYAEDAGEEVPAHDGELRDGRVVRQRAVRPTEGNCVGLHKASGECQ